METQTAAPTEHSDSAPLSYSIGMEGEGREGKAIPILCQGANHMKNLARLVIFNTGAWVCGVHHISRSSCGAKSPEPRQSW